MRHVAKTPTPVDNFRSFMVYCGQHRSMLDTDQKPTPVLDAMVNVRFTPKNGHFRRQV